MIGALPLESIIKDDNNSTLIGLLDVITPSTGSIVIDDMRHRNNLFVQADEVKNIIIGTTTLICTAIIHADADVSSVNPTFVFGTETKNIVRDIEEEMSYPNLEDDVFIKMSPLKRWDVKIKVQSIQKAKPHIVESDEL